MVLNGHVFAMYGLHDYWQLTGDDAASPASSWGPVDHRAERGLGVPQGQRVKRLLLRHKVNTPSYHPIHVEQFLVLWRMTKDSRWITSASLFRTDYPQTGPDRASL